MRFTEEEIAEAGKRARAEREAQGLTAGITDQDALQQFFDAVVETKRLAKTAS